MTVLVVVIDNSTKEFNIAYDIAEKPELKSEKDTFTKCGTALEIALKCIDAEMDRIEGSQGQPLQ